MVTRVILNSFPHWQCGHVSREVNKAAHTLAKEAISQCMDRTWRDSTPISIFDIVALEQSALF
jgi:hypothetical protein